MFKSRKKQCEEEAKKELEYDYVPTKDLKAEESNEPIDNDDRKKFPWIPVIVMGVIVILMIVCVIVIMAMGGPVNSGSSSI